MLGAAKVFFEEKDLSFFIAGVAEGRNCMVITARRGPVNKPRLIGSVTQFREIYGISLADTNIDQIVTRALDRGAKLYLNRIVHYSDPTDAQTITAAKASLTLKNDDDQDTLTLDAVDEGSWGNTLSIEVTVNEADDERFDVSITFPEQPELNESHTALTMNEDDERYAVTYINTNSKLVSATDEDSGDPFVGDTVTVDDTTLTAGEDFVIDVGSPTTMASSLASAINAQESAVTATSLSNVVTVTAATPGTGGNSIALSRVSPGANISVSGANLSGGAAAVAATGTVTYGSPSNGDTLVVGGTTFTKAASGSATEFSTISELTALIDALSNVNATDNGTTITITAATAGAAGNSITLVKTGSALTLSGATLGAGAGVDGADAIAATGTITINPNPNIIDNPVAVGPVAMVGGLDGLSGLDDDDYIGDSGSGVGFHAFSDIDDAMGLAAPEGSSAAVIAAGIAYCEAREDMVYYCEPPSTVRNATNALAFRKGTTPFSHSAFNSSFGSMYFGRPEVRSPKTSSIIDISNGGDVFGVHAYSDAKSEVWFAPAGLQRGRIPNTLGVHYNVGTPGRRTELDDLSDNQINAIVDFPDEGTVIWDENTLQRTPSALQSLHIRRLLIFMRKSLVKVNRIWLFDPNDPVTWRRVFNLIDPFMKDLQDRRAFYEYLIQCDQDAKSVADAVLNTPERVDRGEFTCRIFIKPTRTLKYLGIEAVITKTDANFKELLDIRTL